MTTSVDLDISGMTCASCAARVETRLNQMTGVEATVNFATEKAHVVLSDSVSTPEVLATVAETGYQAKVRQLDITETQNVAGDDGALVTLRRRLTVSALLTIPIIVLAMVPSLQFANWEWVCLALATPVATWGAWPFHQAAWTNLRHGNTTMDTLISVGVGTAYLWSVYALVYRECRRLLRGRRRRHDVDPGRSLPRDTGQTPSRCGSTCAARSWCQGRRDPPRRSRATGANQCAQRR